MVTFYKPSLQVRLGFGKLQRCVLEAQSSSPVVGSVQVRFPDWNRSPICYELTEPSFHWTLTFLYCLDFVQWFSNCSVRTQERGVSPDTISSFAWGYVMQIFPWEEKVLRHCFGDRSLDGCFKRTAGRIAKENRPCMFWANPWHLTWLGKASPMIRRDTIHLLSTHPICTFFVMLLNLPP